MDTIKLLATGLAGSTALTGLHQALRSRKDAPRVDLLGQQAVQKLLGDKNLTHKQAYYSALAGDVISNSLYYSVIAQTKRPVLTGTLLGVAAGVMAVWGPELFGLNKEFVQSTDKKKYMTIGYYTFAGLVAGVTAKLMKKNTESSLEKES